MTKENTKNKVELKAQKSQSKAKKVKLLLKNYEGRFKSHKELANFKEPVLFLMRRNRKIEFFDNATSGIFEFTHTDGERRRLELNPQFMHTFDYGKKTFRGYIAHEDYYTPLPDDPVTTIETFNIAQDKAMHDIRKWKAKENEGIGLKWKQIMIGLAIIILAIGGVIIVSGLFEIPINIWPFSSGSPSPPAPSAPSPDVPVGKF